MCCRGGGVLAGGGGGNLGTEWTQTTIRVVAVEWRRWASTFSQLLFREKGGEGANFIHFLCKIFFKKIHLKRPPPLGKFLPMPLGGGGGVITYWR